MANKKKVISKSDFRKFIKNPSSYLIFKVQEAQEDGPYRDSEGRFYENCSEVCIEFDYRTFKVYFSFWMYSDTSDGIKVNVNFDALEEYEDYFQICGKDNAKLPDFLEWGIELEDSHKLDEYEIRDAYERMIYETITEIFDFKEMLAEYGNLTQS